jgi:hypothetical protein
MTTRRDQELVLVAEHYLLALQRLPYGKMPSAEAEAYDESRLRIAETSKILDKMKPKKHRAAQKRG